MSAYSEKPNIIGDNWIKYCTVIESMGRGMADLNVRRRPGARRLRSCGRFDQFRSPYFSLYDAESAAQMTHFLTSFQATLTFVG